jgi:hypothetical protein
VVVLPAVSLSPTLPAVVIVACPALAGALCPAMSGQSKQLEKLPFVGDVASAMHARMP